MAVMVAASDLNAALPPSQAAQLLEEAGAAYARCKSVIPPNWLRLMRRDRDACAPIRGIVDAHVARSPARWQAAIRQQGMAALMAGGERVMARADPACDGCGRPSAGLRSCPCRQVRVPACLAGTGCSVQGEPWW